MAVDDVASEQGEDDVGYAVDCVEEVEMGFVVGGGGHVVLELLVES